MEKRTLLAVILSITVFYVFSLLFAPEKKPVQPESTGQAVSAPVSAGQPVAGGVQPSASAPSLPATAQQQDVTVRTGLYTAVFCSRGGALKSLTLKNYREKNLPDAQAVVLGSDADPSALTFSTRASGFNLPEGAPFVADATAVTMAGGEKKQLVFTHNSGQGFTVRKIYTFSGDSYGIKLDTQVFNNMAVPLVGTVQQVMTYPGLVKAKDSRFETAGSYLFSDNSLESDKLKDVSSASKLYDKNLQWSGFADKYFLTAILSEGGSIASVELRKNGAGFLESTVSSPRITVTPGQSVTVVHRLFVGPKDIDILKAQGNSLEQSLDLGWFTVIAKPLLYTLKYFYRYVGNYGVAIIIITIILKALFFPLTHKSYKSMKDMQKIQPMMAALKEKYKDDREGMNKAVMELYRDHKVNPLGGCLPMLVQIPVFFALYKALMFSIELRHAPFYFWITDLSGPDNLFGQMLGLPFVIGPLPLLMGATMFIQQKMTPSTMDPMQAKMMLALPVVFTFMFLNFPSGLVLYWLLNNILTIGQQMYINKLVND
ncbi:membrane protein insertase YidC [Pelobacter propionicus]|uniref:Membrane protein insertase YidC n=1 Tax=Pelobacter propionicus (strain DSM 2379 / NBRC 103807 / OttBd1) TaxID=338966 RepID=YIDC_PELPD|nr:membrane protein insertase YidC [Pelobacter propionicus]A1AV44.1 RecName: Full=Membrane protein insertase YidC; AltName: Full=Foldase YidC; AltName: Full=Membrane integrase YidC; AltName: Full=Membrane protein YidC [Pelobacter propionicus DSM 2379]ABL01215.1 protein translocase subunit yidC [Pelobacter propionicus DSM 2379]